MDVVNSGDLATPALLLDANAMGRNVRRMANMARQAGVALRPHAKSHRCVEIARLLAKAGALGSSCATIGEAEALGAGGIAGILITSPMVTHNMIARLGALARVRPDTLVVADNIANVHALGRLGETLAAPLGVLVDIDVGQGRTGCRSEAETLAVARAIAAQPALRLAGVQAYWGHLQQVMPYDERVRRVDEQAARLRSSLAALDRAGLPPAIVSGGGTGTSHIDAHAGLFTEIQPGSFLFLDSCYGRVPLEPAGNPYETSLFVRASVVGLYPDKAIVNAGLKAFATDSGHPIVAGALGDTHRYKYMGDEHGALIGPPHPDLVLGASVDFVTSHCDPTVNLHDRYQVEEDGAPVASWRIFRH